MRIPRIAVLASELTPSIRIDAVDQRKPPLRHRLIQDAAHLQRLELDQVTIVGMFGFSSQPGDPRQLLRKNREEFCTIDFRHLFAYREMSISWSRGFV